MSAPADFVSQSVLLRITGLDVCRLNYLNRLGYAPRSAERPGSGRYRTYSLFDLVELELMERLAGRSLALRDAQRVAAHCRDQAFGVLAGGGDAAAAYTLVGFAGATIDLEIAFGPTAEALSAGLWSPVFTAFTLRALYDDCARRAALVAGA